MEKVKTHIESITNGNSKGLAYWIAVGVITMVLNFATGIVDKVISMNELSPKDVVVAVNSLKKSSEKQITLLDKISDKLEARNDEHIEMDGILKQILKEAEKMEMYKRRKP